MPRSLSAYASEQELLGYFRIFVTPPGSYQREITLFRDAPVLVLSVSTQDPFTDRDAQLSFPQITIFDSPGEGDLNWLVPNTDVDIVWQNVGGYDFTWRWEGFIASYNFSLSGQESNFTVDCKGAFYALDDYLAIPAYPKRPIPYEILIAQAFDQTEHPCHLGKFRVVFPADWNLTVPAWDRPEFLIALKPWGIGTGFPWTGFTSRSTGSWGPLLTGQVQGLLASMVAEGGRQWSIRNTGQRRPELFLRRPPDAEDDAIIVITLGMPGVEMSGTRDYTQRAGVIYGSGKDDAGTSFSNVQISPDGRHTYFQPYAYSNRMWPRKNNPNYDPRVRPKETQISFQQGMDELAAYKVAQGKYEQLAEPGITGSITLTTDPRRSNGQLIPRMMIKAGATLRIKNLFGVREGVLAHVNESSVDFESLTTTLSFDTKYRDQLTVEEVKARTRDALDPLHLLRVGADSNTINDLVLPWSYKNGSGIIPTPAKEFFNEKLPADATWPYEQYTRMYPPSNPSYKDWYIRIPPMDPHNSNNNWSSEARGGQPTMAIPIRMGQGGQIRLSQLAAYDRNGNVMRVKFHLSVHSSNGIAVNSMPQFPVHRGDPDFPPYLPAKQPGVAGTPDSAIPDIATDYGPKQDAQGLWHNQTHPMYKGAWQEFKPDGTHYNWPSDVNLGPQEKIVGWGTFYEPAGYWPGRPSKGASRTGLLQDDEPWDWADSLVNLDNPTENRYEEFVGQLFVMIYCDDQLDQPVYFMGRFIRTDPGAQS